MKSVAFLDALAEALIHQISSVEKQDRARLQLQEAAQAFVLAPELRDTVTEQVISQTLPKLDPAVRNTLLILMREHQLDQVSVFIQRFDKVREQMGIARVVTAVSSVPLEVPEKEKLTQKLEHLWKTHVQLSTEIDPSILGGLRLTSDGWEFDATLAGRLKRLTQALYA